MSLMKRNYQDAMFVQNACNLSDIAHSLSRVLKEVWEEADELGQGTHFVNSHPLVVLYVDKMRSLQSEADILESFLFCAEMSK